MQNYSINELKVFGKVNSGHCRYAPFWFPDRWAQPALWLMWYVLPNTRLGNSLKLVAKLIDAKQEAFNLRFRHATGMFTLYGQIDFIAGTFALPWSGTISNVNSHH
jgi:hypothetical protein